MVVLLTLSLKRVTLLPLTTELKLVTSKVPYYCIHSFIMTTTTPDPITPNTERVMVRNTVTGFEQGIAALTGLLTAGPVGALASWGVIRGVQGKWAPWAILGIPAAPVLGFIQLVTLGAILTSSSPSPSYTPSNTSQVQQESVYDTPDNSLLNKCRQMKVAQDNLEFGEVMSIAFNMGYEHGVTDADDACEALGVNTRL